MRHRGVVLYRDEAAYRVCETCGLTVEKQITPTGQKVYVAKDDGSTDCDGSTDLR